MQVISKPGTQCPMEGKPREYIGDAEPRDVPESSYYLRLVTDGSLLMVSSPLVGEGRGGAKDITHSAQEGDNDANALPAAGRQTVTKAPETNLAHKGGKSK